MTTPTLRPIARRLRGQPASDGAGVRLTRVIGNSQLPDLDPFLMLDEFGSDKPGDYIAGFPSHPHRGFETVTYMLDGRMRHKDNHGNEGLLTPGSVQWMTAGRGIVHSEMPEQDHGLMRGFQLWVNLPAKDKMSAPRYQEFSAEGIPEVQPTPGVRVKVIAGQIGDVVGPVRQPATDPTYLDIALAAGASFEHALPIGHNVFAYVYEGVATMAGEDIVPKGDLLVFGAGDAIRIAAGSAPARLILVAGRPLNEPVARYGPFVMNTKEEIMQAFVDYQEGRF
ncbi:MAG TPA: pirin family protein [Arenimonas sp.]|uniref:pirin family protein n=1 Tax=Arenimonas sp. TaxID=1872635 RepID=UPI002BBB18CF|nr:pirin family protein [Arenimonas sp.]HMB57088.1 pirin family protein [Arenimonas sp.]